MEPPYLAKATFSENSIPIKFINSEELQKLYEFRPVNSLSSSSSPSKKRIHPSSPDSRKSLKNDLLLLDVPLNEKSPKKKTKKPLLLPLLSLPLKQNQNSNEKPKPDFEKDGPAMCVELFDFQKQSVERILEMVKQRGGWENNGCLLYLEMGFGKTLVSMATMIDMMNNRKKKMKHVFIAVSGTDLAAQWKSEIATRSNFPADRIFVVSCLKNVHRLKSMMKEHQTCVVIMTYFAFSRMDSEKMEKLCDIDFSLAILDEVQYQRNVNTYMFINMEKFFKGLGTMPFILEGTGTPYVNKLSDLAALSKLMNNEPFCDKHEDFHSFATKKWWAELGRGKHVDEYDCWKEMFVVAMKPEDISKVTQSWGFKTYKYIHELPNEGISYKPYFILTHFFTILFEQIESVKAKKFMLEIKQSIFRSIIFMTMILHHPATVISENPAIRNQKSKAKGQSSNDQLRDVFKMCGIKDQDLSWETPSAKLSKIIELIIDIRTKAPDEKIIVCSDYATFLNILYLHLIKNENVSKLGKPVLYAGCGNQKTKTAGLQAFRSESQEFSILLLVTEKAIGLNLQVANHVIFTGASWNPAIDQQAECRVKRPGQKRDVHIHRIYTQGSIDIWLIAKLNEKFQEQQKWLKGIPKTNTHEQFEQKARQLFRLIRGEDAQYLRQVREKFEQIHGEFSDMKVYDLGSTSKENNFTVDFDQLNIDKSKLESSFEHYQKAMQDLTYFADHIRQEKKKAAQVQNGPSFSLTEFDQHVSLFENTEPDGELFSMKSGDFQTLQSIVVPDSLLVQQAEETQAKYLKAVMSNENCDDIFLGEEETQFV